MLVLMMIVAGMAIALAVYFLLSGIFSYEPQMQVDTVERFGIIPSVLVFAICGPVLVLKLWFDDESDQQEQGGLFSLLTSVTVALFWSGVLGVAATQSAFVAFAPANALL